MAKTIYVCPMHPEVLSDKSSTCPKCGMTLIEKEIDTPAPKNSDEGEN